MNWTSVLWFLAILASIPLVLWLVKRSQGLGAHPGAGTARTVAVLPLSASQKLVTVEVGRGDEKLWLVLGVTPSNISTLHTMVALPPLPPTRPAGLDGSGGLDGTGGPGGPHASHLGPVAPPAANFAQLLSRLRGSEPGRHGY